MVITARLSGHGKRKKLVTKGGFILTSNQIAYHGLLETRRSNKAREAETARSNLAQEGETRRHNLATESYSMADLAEKSRHNLATEKVQSQLATETVRHNKAGESLNLKNLQEVGRSNRAREKLGVQQLAETVAHNVATENQAKWAQSSLDLKNARDYYVDLEKLKDVDRQMQVQIISSIIKTLGLGGMLSGAFKSEPRQIGF